MQRVHDDSVPHYIVYNADTRVLNMYPNVVVLEETDVLDIEDLCNSLPARLTIYMCRLKRVALGKCSQMCVSRCA